MNFVSRHSPCCLSSLLYVRWYYFCVHCEDRMAEYVKATSNFWHTPAFEFFKKCYTLQAKCYGCSGHFPTILPGSHMLIIFNILKDSTALLGAKAGLWTRQHWKTWSALCQCSSTSRRPLPLQKSPFNVSRYLEPML